MSHPHPPPSLADASVRVATVNDAPAVGIVQAAVWVDAYSGRLPAETVATFAPQAFAAVWRESLASPPPNHALVVACGGEQVAGFAAIGPSRDRDATATTAEIAALGVHPDARRQGHGSRLANACVDLLREAGGTEVVVWLPADDEATRSFLMAAGFGPDGAYRDREVSPDGDTLREVRLVAAIDPAAADLAAGQR